MEDLLHLRGVHVLSTSYDHILDAVDEINVSFFIHGRHVTGVQPPIGERGGGGLFVVPITTGNQITTDDQLTGGAGGASPHLLIHDCDGGQRQWPATGLQQLLLTRQRTNMVLRTESRHPSG